MHKKLKKHLTTCVYNVEVRSFFYVTHMNYAHKRHRGYDIELSICGDSDMLEFNLNYVVLSSVNLLK